MYTKGRIKQVTWAIPTLFSVSNLLREYTRPIAVGENILLMDCVVWSHVTQHAWISPAMDCRIPSLCRSVLFTCSVLLIDVVLPQKVYTSACTSCQISTYALNIMAWLWPSFTLFALVTHRHLITSGLYMFVFCGFFFVQASYFGIFCAYTKCRNNSHRKWHTRMSFLIEKKIRNS